MKKNLIPVASFALLVLALIAVNVLAGLLPLRLDVTDARLFTLSDGTKAILGKLQEPVTIKLYVPDSVPDAPVGVKTYARRARELLQAYQSASGGKLTLQVFDPKPDSEDEDWAQRYGLTPARMPDGTQLYLGLVVLAGGREATVPFLDPRRERFLEYDVSQALTRVNQRTRPKIGILSYLPIYGRPSMTGQSQGEWNFVQELRKTTQVEYLFQNDLTEVPDGISLVLVVHPKSVSDPVSFALDQFVLRGGKLIVLVDPNSRMDPAAAGGGAPASGNLEKLLPAWGVTYDPNQVVADSALGTRVSTPNQGVVSYPLWITLNAAHMNRDSVISSQLNDITLIDSGAFAADGKSKLKFAPILSSSTSSGTVDLATVRFAGPLEISKMLKPDGKARVLAALLTGSFETAFPGGRPKPPPEPKPAGKDAKPAGPSKNPAPEEKPLTHPILAKGVAESAVLLVGDADFIADRFSVQQANFFGNVITQPINDNLAFILNAVEFLTGNPDLIAIRSRGQVSRPFTRVANMQLQAAQQYQEREQFLSQRLEEVRRRLSSLENQKQQGQKLVLTPAQVQEVRNFRQEEAQVRLQLREVRKVLRQDIENLGSVLLAVNLLAMPLLAAVAGVIIIGRRGKRRAGKPQGGKT